ncbi:DUF6415 family natural product biosynthesis protein [Streptomyces mirabilis]|uniref:DUF6415 family natural product biosynthesis protein n=1 Tax=Streptomyces mirabilis TaxID=68239 RepID=UPI00224E1FAA|nr:DUF6415 family natural product biosynthesis protein [Streptomyces mirabilis]MCX4607006.1 DUF6415 family natural product biosynthesis protein [Streptomyces mirabilis]
MTATGTDDPTTTEPIDALIGAAFDAARDQPTHDRLVEIDRLLRAEIERLQTIARRTAELRPHRSREWYALVNAVDHADDTLQFQLGVMFAAALHVAELARRVRELQAVVGQ